MLTITVFYNIMKSLKNERSEKMSKSFLEKKIKSEILGKIFLAYFN